MNRIILFLLFLPIFGVSQSERDQKLLIRNNSSYSTPRSTESFQKNTFRENSTQNYNFNPRPRPNHNPYYISPYSNFGWGNRWNRWGAPFGGFSYWDNWFWFDNFGYRQPARIYVYENGKRDTIRGKKTNIRFGVSYNTKKMVGGWITIGTKNYFIAEFNKSIQKNQSKFYPDLTMDRVMMWNDQKLPNISNEWSIHGGFGTNLKNINVHALVGFGKEMNNYQYFDELKILSNNGNYSFPNFTQNYFSVKTGVLKDIKSISLKADYNPIRNYLEFGLGVRL